MFNFLKKMSFVGMIMKDYFYVEGFVFSSVIKKRNFDEKIEVIYFILFCVNCNFFKLVFVFIKFKKKNLK